VSLFALHAQDEACQLADLAIERAVIEPSAAFEILDKTCSGFLSNLLLASKSTSSHRASDEPARQLRLQQELVAAVLIVMEPDRVKRMAAMPSLLLLPALEFGAAPTASMIPRPSLPSDTPPAAISVPAAEAVEAAEDGYRAAQSVGRPPLAPKSLASYRPVQETSSEKSSKTSISTDSLDSMALYSIALFLSQTWRSIASHGLSATVTMEAPTTSPASEGVSEGRLLRHHPRAVVTRPAVIAALRGMTPSSSSSHPKAGGGGEGSGGSLVMKGSGRDTVLRLIKDMVAATSEVHGGLVAQVLQSLASLLVRSSWNDGGVLCNDGLADVL
jgi:hypothetical protein